MNLTIAYDLLPKRPTTRTSIVMDHFGIDFETGRHVIAEDLELPIAAGDVVLFTGPSGSGKSSLLRAVADGVRSAGAGVIDIERLVPGEQTLIDTLPLPVEEALRLLSACGLGEAQLMLRTPAELSEGQRYRFRLALAVALLIDRGGEGGRGCGGRGEAPSAWIVADEFTATLDRTLAEVVAFNVRRLAERTGIGFLLATTHEDIVDDLAADMHVRCRLKEEIDVEASPRRQSGDDGQRACGEPGFLATRRTPGMTAGARHAGVRRVSFFDELEIRPGTKSDWVQFARWHYRSPNLGFVRQVWLLCRGQEQVGICVFVSPPTSLKARNRYFGRSGQWERTSMRLLNRQLLMLSRVVLHPTYRGAGIAAWFVQECCRRSGSRWVETLAQMGHIHPLFERAGFVRVGSCPPPGRRSRAQHSALYGNRVSEQTYRKSRQAEPVYYVWRGGGGAEGGVTGDGRVGTRAGPHPDSSLALESVPLPGGEGQPASGAEPAG